jgi:hypothetical protein
MPNHRRDALLALVALATLSGFLLAERALGALWRLHPAVSGVLGALLIELGFLRYDTLAGLWERPAVQLGGVLTVIAGGVWAYNTAGPAVVAVLCWGVLTYVFLLGVVFAVGHNPLAVGK